MVTNRYRPSERVRALSGVGDSILVVLGSGFRIGASSRSNFDWHSARMFRGILEFLNMEEGGSGEGDEVGWLEDAVMREILQASQVLSKPKLNQDQDQDQDREPELSPAVSPESSLPGGAPSTECNNDDVSSDVAHGVQCVLAELFAAVLRLGR